MLRVSTVSTDARMHTQNTYTYTDLVVEAGALGPVDDLGRAVVAVARERVLDLLAVRAQLVHAGEAAEEARHV